MAIYWPTHDPQENLDYVGDWSAALDGDTIASTTFTEQTVDGGLSGITLGVASFTNSTTKQWISGGTVGKQAVITNRVVTAGGRTLEQTFILPIGPA